ncbi:Uncharacterised protein [Mycobacterium tuberculosis]|uniref:Uncharacterized protein n=1 Tax=Mycobacterium tuberculosis TaxID=1773 RepID=A0A655JIW5_MYCTX|nr:Uncharacterised protein [Mycobacterium tuberculosis]SGO55980.1 Uncharacterised protein [Mycobacterium tuberculosis]
MEAYNAWRTSSVNVAGSAGCSPSLPEARPLAAERCPTDPERARANTASAMPVTGTPRSSADLTVQRPVPFCSARSTMTSTSGLPVLASVCRSTSAVISTR